MTVALGDWSPLLGAGVVCIFIKLMVDTATKALHDKIDANTKLTQKLGDDMRAEVNDIRGTALEADRKAKNAVDAQALCKDECARKFVRREDLLDHESILQMLARCKGGGHVST